MSITVYGWFDQDGNLKSNSGQIEEVKHLGKGRYAVSFKKDTFKSVPVVVATVMVDNQNCGAAGTNRTVSITDVTRDQVCFGVRKASAGNEDSDRPISFIATGDVP